MKDNSSFRVILVVLISLIVIVLWGYFFGEKPRPAQNDVATNAAPKTLEQKDTLQEAPKAPIISRIVSKDFEIEIDALGRFSQVYLKDKKYTQSKDLGFFEHIKILFGIKKAPEHADKLALFSDKFVKPLELRFKNPAINELAFKTNYVASSDLVEITNEPKTLSLVQKLGDLSITKNLIIYPDLHYKLDIKLSKNESFFVTNGSRPVSDNENYAFNGVISKNADDKITKIEDGDIKELQSIENARFVASVDRYYSSLFYALDSNLLDVKIDASALKDPIPFVEAQNNISLGGFIGPKIYDLLEGLDPHLTSVVEYGLVTFFAKPLFLLLEYLHKLSSNWGFAIILLTIIVKILLYPLSYKGMVSMQRLKDIAPKMKELQAKYKKEPEKLRIQMMNLYKKHGANPMSGCLPLIIQIPIFYAIYRVLYNSVELKSAPFILWIHDLSVLDPYFVLPVLMGISLYIQQSLTPNTMTDPIQAKIFKMLPVIFTLFLIFFPAGLVLYWTINNILSILQQLAINKMLARKKIQ
ncbi:MAG: membrane protein insertase YidC [Helicobacter sp.]|nr:membrane protein insertase YidC [Helicobacter sp.]